MYFQFMSKYEVQSRNVIYWPKKNFDVPTSSSTCLKIVSHMCMYKEVGSRIEVREVGQRLGKWGS